jgi:beta-phosphoglucomutase-like phosphatase (HAD superfamily)
MTEVIKGFFFDLDGTLVNTHEANFRAYRQAIREVVGKEANDELKERIMRGESSSKFIPCWKFKKRRSKFTPSIWVNLS